MAELALSVKEAAELLGLSECTIYRMVYAGRIPFKRIQTSQGKKGLNKIIIPRAALERWLNTPDEPTKEQSARRVRSKAVINR